MPERAGWLKRAAEQARRAAGTLKDEFDKGKAGSDEPVQTIGPTAVDALKRLMSRWADDAATPSPGAPAPEAAAPDAAPVDADEASTVSRLLRGVDWRQVSAKVQEQQTVQKMRDLASQVDWGAAKPVAARVGTALIAAAASGQIRGLDGRTGALVARTIIDEAGLAERVSKLVNQDASVGTAPIRDYIDTTAVDTTPGFEAELDGLRRAIGPGPTGAATG